MEHTILSSFDQINEKEWDTLLLDCGQLSPFLKYGYQRTWWQYLGGGEWDHADLRIIRVEENGKLIGIAPLFEGEAQGRKQIHFVGSFEISDYLDFIVLPEQSERFIRQIFRIIANDPAFSTRELVLYNIPDNSPTIAALNAFANDEEIEVNVERAYHTPAIQLPDNWDKYLESIDKKQRHEIRRKIRRAETSEEDSIVWHIIGQEDELQQAIADFTSLMKYDPEKEKFLSSNMLDQMGAIILWAAKEGVLQLSFLTVNGEKAAAYLCFNYAGRIWVYNSGFSPDFSYYSPGWVLLGYLIQHAITTGKTHFDFMRGDEKYKYRFGAQDSFVMKASIRLDRA